MSINFAPIFWVDVIFPFPQNKLMSFFHFHKINWCHFSIFPFPQKKRWLHIGLNSTCENTHLWNLNRASNYQSAMGVRNCTKPPQGIRVDTCKYWYIRLCYIIMVIEKSNAWSLHVTVLLNFFRSQMSPQKASRSLMGLSWHPVVLWEFYLKYPELVVLWFWLFKYPDPTVLWFWIIQLPTGTTILLFWFFFKYLEPTKIEGPPNLRNLSMLGGY
jgi:hypothetical protein